MDIEFGADTEFAVLGGWDSVAGVGESTASRGVASVGSQWEENIVSGALK